MGKRLAKRELFREIKVEREALNTLLKQIKPRQMTLPGVTPGGWSVKDILAHVVGWQGRILEWHEAEQRGENPAVPAPGLTWRDLKRFNEMIYQEHRLRISPSDHFQPLFAMFSCPLRLRGGKLS